MKRETEQKLDIFPHIFPLEYFERMKTIAEGNPGLAASLKRWMHIPVLWDLERRIKMERVHHGWSHGRVRAVDIRAGDTIVVIAGKDRGKRGVVERTIPDQQRIVVRGVNILKRHTRAGVKGNLQGGVVDFDAPIAYSNVMLICNRCDRPTRISRTVSDTGESFIVCKKCGERYERTRVG